MAGSPSAGRSDSSVPSNPVRTGAGSVSGRKSWTVDADGCPRRWIIPAMILNTVAIILLLVFALARPAGANEHLAPGDLEAYLSYTPPSPPPVDLHSFESGTIVIDCGRWIDGEFRLVPCEPVTYTPEHWRPLVERFFPANRVEQAISVMRCESAGNPLATNSRSGAAGLFQHLPRYWEGRSTAAGFAGVDIYNPSANVAVAAWLAADGVKKGLTYWHHWVCKP